MGIELILEEATPEQTEESIRNSPFEILARQGYKLFFGARIGTARNQFWYNPSTGKFAVDHVQLDDIVTDLISILSILVHKKELDSIEKKQERDRTIMASIGQLNGYLAQNLAMYNDGKIDMQGSVLGIPNKELYDVVNGLRKITFALSHIPIGTPEFAQKVEELSIFYRETMLKYPQN